MLKKRRESENQAPSNSNALSILKTKPSKKKPSRSSPRKLFSFVRTLIFFLRVWKRETRVLIRSTTASSNHAVLLQGPNRSLVLEVFSSPQNEWRTRPTAQFTNIHSYSRVSEFTLLLTESEKGKALVSITLPSEIVNHKWCFAIEQHVRLEEKSKPKAQQQPLTRRPSISRNLLVDVVTEFFVTEEDYVRDLALLQTKYRKEFLHNQTRFKLKLHEIDAIFLNTQELLVLHQNLLSQCAPFSTTGSIREEDCNVACDVLVTSLTQRLKLIQVLYKNYNYQLATVTLEACTCRSSALTKFLNQNPPALTSLLIKPIQRLCKYPLFLKQFVSWMEKDGRVPAPLLQRMNASLDSLHSVLREINQHNASREWRETELMLLCTFVNMPNTFTLASPSRRFLHEFAVHHLLISVEATTNNTSSSTKPPPSKKWTMFLFNDGILFAKPLLTPQQFKYRGWFELRDLTFAVPSAASASSHSQLTIHFQPPVEEEDEDEEQERFETGSCVSIKSTTSVSSRVSTIIRRASTSFSFKRRSASNSSHNNKNRQPQHFTLAFSSPALRNQAFEVCTMASLKLLE